MRIYKLDGSYTEDTNDTEFGWKLSEIIVDETVPSFQERNRENRIMSRLTKLVRKDSMWNDSVDVSHETDQDQPRVIEKIDPKIEVYPVQNVIECQMELEGYNIEKVNTDFERGLVNIDEKNPNKEQLISLIRPYNIETKMLLSVISFAKYKTLNRIDTSQNLFRTINFKTTNFEYLLYNDKQNELEDNLLNEIEAYHANRSDNKLSLMMELILRDLDSNIDEIDDDATIETRTKLVNNDGGSNGNNSLSCLETSDLGISLQSSSSSKEETNLDKSNELEVKNRSDVLSRVGISEDFDKSCIQNFSTEVANIHSQIDDIRASFEIEENRVKNLLLQAKTLKRELKETVYLSNILHMLNGDLDKIKSKKGPFKMFYIENTTLLEDEFNFIV